MYNIQVRHSLYSPLDWCAYGKEIIEKEGGKGLIQHKGLYQALKLTFPDSDWEPVQPILDPEYWNSLDNQRKYLDYICKTLDIKKKCYLVTLSENVFEDAGAMAMRNRYSSILHLLKTIYPEYYWPPLDDFNEWRNQKDHRVFFDYAKAVFNVQKSTDWKKVTLEDIERIGGGIILRKYPSFFDALISIYPEERFIYANTRPNFNRKKLLQNPHWREYLDQISFQLNVSRLEDWYEVRTRDLLSTRSSSTIQLLSGHVHELIPKAYPEFPWDKFKFSFSRNFWLDFKNQMEYLDYLIAKFNLSSPSDLVFVNVGDLKYSYNHLGYSSFLEMLLSVFPHHRIDILQKTPPQFWNCKNNIRTLLREITLLFNIRDRFGWENASLGQLKLHPGMNSLLSRFNDDLFALLDLVYPNVHWDIIKPYPSDHLSVASKTMRRNIHLTDLGSEEILEDFHFEELNITVDLYMPEKRAAFRCHSRGEYSNEKDRFKCFEEDQVKRDLFHKIGITLIIVPFWDNASKACIKSRLSIAKRSDLADLIRSSRMRTGKTVVLPPRSSFFSYLVPSSKPSPCDKE